MKRKTLAIAIATTLGSLLTVPLMAADAAITENSNNEVASLQDAIKGGTVDLNFRMRLESVDQDNSRDDALASTLKSRLTYTTQAYKNFQGQIEVDNTSDIGDENHCDSQNDMCDSGPGQHSVVADPEGTELNQAWIAYTGLKNTTIKHGRQRVNLDNQRFIGGVAWRQNEQTYDATSIVNTSLPDTTVIFAYVKGVNTITDGDLDTDTTLLNVSYTGLSFAKVALYNYDIEAGDGGDTFNTSGIRFTGSPEIAGLKVSYEIEYAKQDRDVYSSSANNDAKYTHVALGTTVGPVNVKLGQEVLGSDSGLYGFQTPLATKHKFNGFADVFLATPIDGLEDNYLTLSGKVAGAKVSFTYHEFDADKGSMDYGDEIDLAISKKVLENTTVLLKYADYSQGGSTSGKVDTQKVWLQAQVNF